MPSSAICKEPLIHTSNGRTDNAKPQSESTSSHEDERGDILIRGFWHRGTDCILDVRITDVDAKSCLKRDPAKVIE